MFEKITIITLLYLTPMGDIKQHSFEIPSTYNKDKLKLVGIVVKKDNKVINSRLSELSKTQSFEEL